MEYESCYVFEPPGTQEGPSRKKRRIENHGLQASWPARRKIYERLWAQQEARLRKVLSDLNETTVTAVTDFIDQAPLHNERLPSAILVTGPSLASHDGLFDQISEATGNLGRLPFVSLTSQHAPNLKTLLKHLIAKATSIDTVDEGDDEDELAPSKRKGPRLLKYDLQILHNAVEEQKLEKVVVAFQDCEAFDGILLSDAIELLSSWKDRIPFVLLFGVATSIEGLQAKLSRRAIRQLDGRRFDVVQAESAWEQLFLALHAPQSKIWLGSGLCSTLIARQRDHIQSLQAFVDAVQYAYMTNFYANAPSILLDQTIKPSQLPRDHYEAIRSLPSFATHCEDLLDRRQARLVRQLLDDDQTLFRHAREQVQVGQDRLVQILDAVTIFAQLQASFSNASPMTASELYVQALAGRLRGSTTEKNMLLSARRANSDVLMQLLQDLNAVASGPLRDNIESVIDELSELLSTQEDPEAPLRSEQELSNSTLRTTVIAKRVELSKQKSKLTKADAAFSDILNRFVGTLEDFFTTTLIDPKGLPFNEIFIYDLKSPHREVFTPKPRVAIERALASPHDYLGCDCCAPQDATTEEGAEEATLSATQPATAILYQLYLESGALINAADLRSALAALLSDEVDDDAKLSALFQRSLAELKYLGLVKGTKKRADHVLKLSWKGL